MSFQKIVPVFGFLCSYKILNRVGCEYFNMQPTLKLLHLKPDKPHVPEVHVLGIQEEKGIGKIFSFKQELSFIAEEAVRTT